MKPIYNMQKLPSDFIVADVPFPSDQGPRI